MASGLKRKAAENMLSDRCRACSAWNRLSARRRCFLLVRTRRAVTTIREAVIAAQTTVADWRTSETRRFEGCARNPSMITTRNAVSRPATAGPNLAILSEAGKGHLVRRIIAYAG